MTWPRRPFARKRRTPEDDLHIAVADFLRAALPPEAFWTTIPTGNLSRLQAARMKRKGYTAGTPDIVICYGARTYWIELKAPAGVVSDDQRAAHAQLARACVPVALAKSLGEIEFWLCRWNIPLRATTGATEPRAVQGARSTA